MKKQKSPFENFVNHTLHHLGKQNSAEDTPIQDAVFDLEGLLGDNFPKSRAEYLEKRFGNAVSSPQSPLAKKLDKELGQLMDNFQNATRGKNLKDIQKQIQSWELRVRGANITSAEQTLLLEKASVAQQFSQY